MAIAACYAVWNEAGQITDSIRSVKAYVDRFVVVDCAFTTNPAATAPNSTDGTRAVVERACAGVPLTYIEPDYRLEEHHARNLYIAASVPNDWMLIIDGDEILYGDHYQVQGFLRDLRHEPEQAIALRIYTTAVMFDGYADEMGPETYDSAPIISTWGYQPRLVRKARSVRHRRIEVEPGVYTHSSMYVGREPLKAIESDAALIVNMHVRQPFAGYQADYAWESAQRVGAV